MRETHVELIDPMEKLSPSIGGTGYVGPTQPAEVLSLYINAAASLESWPELNATVWKVLRSSVNWTQCAQYRRLKVGGRVVPCSVIGGNLDWWFVSVDATKAIGILSTAEGMPRESMETKMDDRHLRDDQIVATDKCPHCAAIPIEQFGFWLMFACGSSGEFGLLRGNIMHEQTELCKTRAQLALLQAVVADAADLLDCCYGSQAYLDAKAKLRVDLAALQADGGAG
jgi:hypothetical protein